MPNPNTSIKTGHAVTIRANGKTVGKIQVWNPTQSRQVTHAYEVNAATSGTVVENVPGNITGLNVRVDRYDLYKAPMEAVWGGPRLVMLTDQTNPLTIHERYNYPDGTVETFVYVGVWFSSLGYTISSTGDRIVNKNATLVYQKYYIL